MTLQELIDANVAVLDKRKALSDKAASENRSFTEDEQKEYDTLTADYGQRKETIKRQRDLEEEQRSLDALPPHPCPAPTPAPHDPARRQEVNAPVIHIPRATHKLRCFKGEGAELRAEACYRWYLGARHGVKEARHWCDKRGIEIRTAPIVDSEKRAMGEAVNTAGGYLVPDLFQPEMLRLVEERGVFRANADSWPMNSASGTFPRRVSGVTAYAVSESGEITASDAGADMIRVTPKKWATLTRIASELNEDSAISTGDWIATEIAYAFADKQDEAGFNGDGTSTYHGVHGVMVKAVDGNHAGTVYDAASGNTAFSTLDLVDFEGMAGQLPSYAEGGARWYISKKGFFASMSRLMTAAGGNTIDHIAGGTGLQFLGSPVVITQVLNSTLTAQASTAILAYGDLRCTRHDDRGR
jgi:HK97 family phage major capsid protein